MDMALKREICINIRHPMLRLYQHFFYFVHYLEIWIVHLSKMNIVKTFNHSTFCSNLILNETPPKKIRFI